MTEEEAPSVARGERDPMSVEAATALVAGHLAIIMGVPRRYPAMPSAVAALHRIYGIPIETLGQLYRELVNERSGPPWHVVAEEVPAVLAEWDAKRARSGMRSEEE